MGSVAGKGSSVAVAGKGGLRALEGWRDVAHAWVVCLPGRNRRRTYARVALPCALPAVVVLQIGGRPKADRWYAQSECIHTPSVVPRAQV